MTGNTPESLPRALGRRIAQVTLAGAIAATPFGLATAIAPAAHADTDWDAVAECESSGDWNTNTGNGFGGGLQFTDSTWKAFGGSGQPEEASRSEQIAVAERVKDGQGMGAWPTCSKKTGQTSSAANSGSDSGSTSTSASASTSESKQSVRKESTATSKPSPAKSSAKKTGTATTSPARSGSYTVVAGDTLTRIASRHGVSGGASALAERNDIADPDVIMVGQKLVLS